MNTDNNSSQKRKASEITLDVSAPKTPEIAYYFKIISILLSHDMETQTVITYGDQSTGKSSVLNSIIGASLLPNGKFTTTTCGVKVKVIQEKGPKFTLLSNELTTPKMEKVAPCNMESERSEIMEDQLSVLFSKRSEDLSYDQIVEITMRSPDAIPLTFYDFPGPRTMKDIDNSKSNFASIRGCKSPCVLLATKLNEDLDFLKRDVTEAVKLCSNHGNQIILVVTHLDNIVDSMSTKGLEKFLKSYMGLKEEADKVNVKLDVVIVQSGVRESNKDGKNVIDFAEIRRQEEKNIAALLAWIPEQQRDGIPELGIDKLRYKLAQTCLGKVNQEKLAKLESDLASKLQSSTKSLDLGKFPHTSGSLMGDILPRTVPHLVATDSVPELERGLVPLLWKKVDQIYSTRGMTMQTRPTPMPGSVIKPCQGKALLEKEEFQYNERSYYIEKMSSLAPAVADLMFESYYNSLPIMALRTSYKETPTAKKWLESHLNSFFASIRDSLVKKNEEIINSHKFLVCTQGNLPVVPMDVEMRKDMTSNELVASFLPDFGQIVQNIAVMLMLNFSEKVIFGFRDYIFAVLPNTAAFTEMSPDEIAKLQKICEETEKSLESVKKIRADILKTTGFQEHRSVSNSNLDTEADSNSNMNTSSGLSIIGAFSSLFQRKRQKNNN